ncbi:unnamed protein product [Rhodiola kirilowii]
MAASGSSADCNKEFATDYMLLDQDKLGIKDLYHILFSSDIENRNSIDTSAAREDDISRRWIIFISILAQKLLQLASKPLSKFGSAIEYWLNLLSCNGGFFRLVLKILRGDMVQPDKESSTFLSFTGNMDTRVDLDETIKNSDGRYHPALAMMAAKASYENKAYIENIVKNSWQMDFLGSFDYWNDYQGKYTTQAFLLHDKQCDPDVVVVAFRGTETFDADAWCSDFDISWYAIPGMGNIHGGFMKALGLVKSHGWPKEVDDGPPLAYYEIRKMLRDILSKNDKTQFIVTGHSLGGALAILFPSVLALHEEDWMLDRLLAVYTFGQPRVGDETFGHYMEENFQKHDIRYFRFVYNFDIVPRLPYDDTSLMFKHFGTCIFFDSYYEAKIVAEEPNKNYFSLKYVIPKTICSCRELIRSFTIHYLKGPVYVEGGLCRFFRVIGLMINGVPNHMPQDYVNSTRLAASHLFHQHQKKLLHTNGTSSSLAVKKDE